MYVQKKPIENTHIVRERDRQRFRELLAVLTLGVPIGLFLLLFTWQNLEVIRLGHAATRLQQQRKALQDANTALQLEIDRLTSLESVETRAAKLGFISTPPHAVVMVESISVRSTALPTGPTAQPAAAAPAPSTPVTEARR